MTKCPTGSNAGAEKDCKKPQSRSSALLPACEEGKSCQGPEEKAEVVGRGLQLEGEALRLRGQQLLQNPGCSF